jgi:excisionase family DNA binding protein
MEKLHLEDLPTMMLSIKDSLNRIERILNERYIESKIGDEVFTVQKAAEFLSLKPSTIYSLIRKRCIPTMKRNGRSYFLKTELLEYLKKGRVKTQADFETIANRLINKHK